jgi:hypothetical protein
MTEIRSKLLPYFSSLSFEEVALAQRAVGCLVLLDSVKIYDDIVGAFQSEESLKAFQRPVKAFLTDSFTARNIWRAAIYASGNQIAINSAADTFKVDADDVYFCLDGLNAEDQAQVRAQGQEQQILLKPIPKSDLNKLMSRLGKFCKQVAYRKLRFLQTTDNAILMEDINSDLITKALKIVRHYEHLTEDGTTHALLKIENYAKHGIMNYATNMINFHTTRKRARVQNVTETCGTCDYCLTGQITHCRNAVNSYQATTLRLDLPATVESSTPIVASLRAHHIMQDDILVEDEMLRNLLVGASAEVQTFVNIITDKHTPVEFENWLMLHYNIRMDDVTDDRKMTNYALEFLDLQKVQTRKTLQTRYNRYISDRR